MTNKNDYAELVKSSLDQLEKYQNNVEKIISTFTQIINLDTKKNEYSEEEKLKAAYALNLCTVSISQIIDYNDILVLEQEYEMILNNLNLENIPKDEALLNILKQILDTVTFFRIQKSDKKFIEIEYQNNMKNALWSAVPNFGLIVAGGDPISMAVSLASQVGIGYMNYRKTKATNRLGLNREMWKLQRSAIEQLNGLRRELFDTAWRLAEVYNFPDEYRLTEKQIEQYNTILMDSDPIRKYERLDTIKYKFKAYVPFWYHFGNTANQISQDLRFSFKTRNRFRESAIEHFETYHKLNSKNLLREDYIASACALEYVDLLNSEKDKDKINKLINLAEKNSGDSNDVLQLCAVAFLNHNDMNSAERILKQLINEEYNTVINAQILSNIYVSKFVYKNNPDVALSNYEILKTRVAEEYLFPLPMDGIYDIEKLNKDFFENQRKILRIEYQLILNEFIKKYTIKYNKIFPIYNQSGSLEDNYFLDGEIEREKRIKDLERTLSIKKEKLELCDQLKDGIFIYNIFEVINEMYNGLSMIGVIDDYEMLELLLTSGIMKCKKLINIIMDSVSKNEIDNVRIEMFSELSFRDFVYEFFKEVNSQLMNYVNKTRNMSDIDKAEFQIYKFSIAQGLPNHEELFKNKNRGNLKAKSKKIFSLKLIGVDYAELEKEVAQKNKIKEIIFQHKDKINVGDKINLIIEGTDDFNNYFRKKNSSKIIKWKADTIAILEGKSWSEFDLLLTSECLVIIKQHSLKGFVWYYNVNLKEDRLILNGDDSSIFINNDIELITPIYVKMLINHKKKKRNFEYKNKNIDISELYLLFKEIDKEVPKVEKYAKNNGNYSLFRRDDYDFLSI